MSGKGGYSPASPKLTAQEFQEFKRVFADEPWIKRAIYAAGIASVLEAIHILWLAARILVLCTIR
jgi:hypothetical protein